MSTTGQLVYDPAVVLADVLSNNDLAADLAFALACHELNPLVGFLESYGRHGPAALWKSHHLDACDEPERHTR